MRRGHPAPFIIQPTERRKHTMKKGMKIKHLKEVINKMDDDLEIYIVEIEGDSSYNLPIRSINIEEQITYDEFSERLEDKKTIVVMKTDCNNV